MVGWAGIIHKPECRNHNPRSRAAFEGFERKRRLLRRVSPSQLAEVAEWCDGIQRHRAAQRQEKALARLRGKSTSGASSDTSPDVFAYVDPAELREVIGRYINLVEGDTELELLQHHAVAYVRGDEGAHKSLMKFVKPLLARR